MDVYELHTINNDFGTGAEPNPS